MTLPEPRSPDPNPRAFVTASGYLFQGAGLVLACSTCCLWSISGWTQGKLHQPVDGPSDYLRLETLPWTVAMLSTVLSFAGGLGRVAGGLGLQGERPSSGRWALGISGLLAAVWWLRLAVDLWWWAGWGRLLVNACLAVAAVLLFLLAGNCARLLRLHPPPDNLGGVSDEYLEEYSRRRHESQD